MSSLIAVNTSEGESILPEVEELSEFHPDQLSSIVDIQEELDKLEASENVGNESILSMSTVEDVNVVDHEVTIVADQASEEICILPDIPEMGHVEEEPYKNEKYNDSNYNNFIEESLDIGETITIGNQNLLTSKVVDEVNNLSRVDSAKYINTCIKPAGSAVGQSPVNVSQLKAIRPLPEALKGKKPFITLSQTKQNVLTKVIFTPNNQAAPDAPIIFGEAGGQTIRIVGQNKTIIANSPKTITLAQAREMGLLSPAKIQHILPSQSKSMVKKGVMMSANKTVTMKSSPAKILPLPTGQLHPIAPSPTVNNLGATQHKIFIRQSTSAIKPGAFSGTILASNSTGAQGQILQLPVSQDSTSNQIHQIQLPGKQVQYVRLMNSTTSTSSITDVSNTEPVESKSEPIVITPASSGLSRPVPVALTTNVNNTSQLKIVPLAPAHTTSVSSSQDTSSFERVLVSPGLNQLTARPDTNSPASNIVMVPAEYVKQYKPSPVTHSPPSPPKSVIPSTLSVHPPKSKDALSNKEVFTTQTAQKNKSSTDPPNGIRPRKPCNCTKSQCLKLYCDCFANGEFCYQCNCNSCFNNLDHEEERQRAIKACLERNPNAFRPKIGKGYIGDERRHNKGCNCKRSGCLKNYCECYEAKIPCSNNCKCIGCRNVEEKDSQDRNTIDSMKTSHQIAIKNKLSSEIQESAYKPHAFLTSQGSRQPFNLMTQEVVEATCQCLLSQIRGDGQLTEQVERLILEEFGRCLVEIIDCATRTTVNNVT